MFRKLRNKFLFLNMLVTSLVMLTAFGIVYLTTYNNINTEIKQKLDNVTGSFAIKESGSPSIDGNEPPGTDNAHEPAITSQKVTSDYLPSFVITVDKTGKITDISSMIDISNEQYTQAAQTAWNLKNNDIITISGRLWRYKVVPMKIIHTKDGVTQVETTDYSQISFLDITDMQKTLNNLLFTFLFVGIGMLAIIFIVSIFYANRSIRPISENWKKQKRFIADASHELKTPLTTIMTNCDVLEANEDESVKSQKEWLGYIKIGADRMSRLVNNLLILAQSEGMNVQAQKQSFDMAALVCEILQSMEASAAVKKLQIDRKVEFVGDIYGYEDSVRQVVTILYENAVKYTDESGHIDTAVRRTRKGVAFSVKNTGKGIPAKDLPHIFDRFYRADAARTNEENSYGLGLSIAKSIAEQIGGKITVTSVPDGWTEFIFAFEI